MPNKTSHCKYQADRLFVADFRQKQIKKQFFFVVFREELLLIVWGEGICLKYPFLDYIPNQWNQLFPF